MAREIKFRVYTEVEHEWLGMKYFDLKDAKYNTNDTVMQFTGLTDKNGKEIYEGDIVRRGITTKEVKWTDKVAMGWNIRKNFHAYDRDFEIIGNIWENPDLLAQKLD